jgi:DNA-binding NtrC family response regulator
MIEPRGEVVREMVEKGQCDVVILDLDSSYGPLDEQVSLYEEIASSPVAILLMADDGVRSTALELVQRGAFGYLHKPPSLRELKVMVRRAHESNTINTIKGVSGSAKRELQLPYGCGDLIGASAPMLVVYDLIRRVADLDVSVIITGDSGTGKELVAAAIHDLGARSRRPFVAVSCGAIPESLIEAELFGHEKGAFTGTTGLRQGYFEKAGDGTVLLDEIGELSLQTQVKLLRVLQQREFCRLGSSNPISLRARVLFATHRNLEQMVAAGKFRQDLFYRINVMSIQVPVLISHPEDISLLALHFLRRYSETYRKTVTAIEPDALRALERYHWPGNIRELENVMQRAIVMAELDSIRQSDLPEAFQEIDGLELEEGQGEGSFESLVRDYRVKLANEAILECNGNKTLAAQRLSISRAYLHRLLRPASSPSELSLL